MQLPTYEDMLLPLCTDTRISEWVPLGNTCGLIAGTKPCRLSGTSLSLDLTSLVLRWSKNFISLLLNVWPPPPKKNCSCFVDITGKHPHPVWRWVKHWTCDTSIAGPFIHSTLYRPSMVLRVLISSTGFVEIYIAFLHEFFIFISECSYILDIC